SAPDGASQQSCQPNHLECGATQCCNGSQNTCRDGTSDTSCGGEGDLCQDCTSNGPDFQCGTGWGTVIPLCCRKGGAVVALDNVCLRDAGTSIDYVDYYARGQSWCCSHAGHCTDDVNSFVCDP